MAGKSESQKSILNLEQYHVDLETGFMLQEPLKLLPPYFDPWNNLASNLPELVKQKQVREAVDKLPLLDHGLLKGHRQLRLAHLQLSFIASGYVWQEGDEGVAKILPMCVAVPFFHVSALLGIQPVLGHASLALANWVLANPNGPCELENLKCLYHLPGESGAEWFVTVTANVEFTFAKCLKHLLGILEETENAHKAKASGESVTLVLSQAEVNVARYLDQLKTVIAEMQAALSRMHDRLAAKIFFNVLRPFLGGWGGEGNSLPEGLVYEGISDQPMKMPGGSAAQSTTLQVLDALLGVEHTLEKRAFLVHMRDFMPPDHRRLVEDLENWPHKLRDFVLLSQSTVLQASYNSCVLALVKLRTYHIQIVTKYIIMASREANEGKYGSLDNKGTGGTSLIPFLKVLRSDTEEKLLPGSKDNQPHSFASNLASQPKVIVPGASHSSRLLLVTAAVSTLVVGVMMKSLKP